MPSRRIAVGSLVALITVAVPCGALGALTPTTVNFVESSGSQGDPQNGVTTLTVPSPVDGSELALATLATRGSGSGITAPKGWRLLRQATDSAAGEEVKVFYSFPPSGQRVWSFTTGASDAGALVEIYSGVDLAEPFTNATTGAVGGFSLTAPSVNVTSSARFAVSLWVTTPTSGYSVQSPWKETGASYSEPKATMTFIAADRVLNGSGKSPGAVLSATQVTGGQQQAVSARIILNHS
jgi:hypothetical protein